MEHRRLGHAGPMVSTVGLGCNNLGGRVDSATARQILHKALDLGVSLLDTADTYGNRGGSEEELGRILGDRRKDFIIATKFGLPMDDAGILSGASRRYILSAVEASLRRLKTDWIDLYQLHQFDPATPIEETLRALDDLVGQGKVRFIGCSNATVADLAGALDASRQMKLTSFVSSQEEYSLLVRKPEHELLPLMAEKGVGMLPYFPLAGGLLTGKYARDAAPPEGSRFNRFAQYPERFLNERNWRSVEGLQAFCTRRGCSMLQLAFSWLLQRPMVASVIAGASNAAQLEQNVLAGQLRFSDAEFDEIDAMTTPS